MDDVYIGIALDGDFEPGNYADNQAEIDEAVAKINAGEWAAYKIGVLDGEGNIIDVMGGVVADAGYEGRYESPERIQHGYLRATARSLLGDEPGMHDGHPVGACSGCDTATDPWYSRDENGHMKGRENA
jgi:hypothetical protein